MTNFMFHALIILAALFCPISSDITNWSVSPDQEGPIIWKTTVTFSCSWTVRSRNYGDFLSGEPGNLVSMWVDPQYKDLIAANDPDARVYANMDDVAGTATLTIKDVTKADERSFVCSVTGYGSSELIALSVLEPPTTGVINFAAVPDFTSVALSWDAVEGATSYSVSWRKVGETDWTSHATSETSKTFEGLVPGSEFEAKVDASNAAGVRPEIQPAEITFTTKDYQTEECPEGYRKCDDGVQCIQSRYMCDGGAPDCDDGSDEGDNCLSYECPEGYRKCDDGLECINANYWCDNTGRPDCEDESDEGSHCDYWEDGEVEEEEEEEAVCGEGERRCDDGLQCIRASFWCANDGEDCGDRSDEGTHCDYYGIDCSDEENMYMEECMSAAQQSHLLSGLLIVLIAAIQILGF